MSAGFWLKVVVGDVAGLWASVLVWICFLRSSFWSTRPEPSTSSIYILNAPSGSPLNFAEFPPKTGKFRLPTDFEVCSSSRSALRGIIPRLLPLGFRGLGFRGVGFRV